tara:strand:+ start:10884 stop:12227 length:1344 start_codon:yes stop_codon:yes gene_type:complete
MNLKILIIGQGGREHAIAWKLGKSNKVNEIFVAPGNGGTYFENKVTNVNINSNDKTALIDFVKKNSIDITIVGPEAPLVDGIVNEFKKQNLKIFGPTKEHAQLEGSKIFAKKFMVDNGIPTANAKSFSQKNEAIDYLKTQKFPIVIKADTLAAGKGVIIAESLDESQDAVNELMDKKGFEKIVIEDFLTGIELSAIYICNYNSRGYEIALPWIKDYKSRDEYNAGPNTGGMGAVTHPLTFDKKNILFKINMQIEKILEKTIHSINQKYSSNYLGFLYIGLMVNQECEVKVLEYNCRLGDPETQNIMVTLNNENIDLLDMILYENQEYGIMPPPPIEPSKFSSEYQYSCTVVLASKGYPDDYKKNYFLDISSVIEKPYLKIFHSGTIIFNGKIKVIGGRILSVNAVAKDKETAVKLAYDNIKKIKAFEDEDFTKENKDLIFFREDIGN